ncbi:RCC1 domain-containing protein [Agromyces humi]|uniref:RCC1 domain-containing protein n=1 Tax=Agromyces humi TaxID=1766800 RepID=UPI00135C9AAB|nr:hypothetical protein [Agromyces humi]
MTSIRTLLRSNRGSMTAGVSFIAVAAVIASTLALTAATTIAEQHTYADTIRTGAAIDARYSQYLAELNAGVPATTGPVSYNGVDVEAAVVTATDGTPKLQLTAVNASGATVEETRELTSAAGTHITGFTNEGAPTWGSVDRVIEGRFSTAGGHAIATGPSRACILDTAGAAWCWGATVGDGTPNGRPTPTRVDMGAVPSGRKLTALFAEQSNAGASGVCALDNAGTAYCWGPNSSGQLGVGAGAANRPTPVLGDHRFTTLTMDSGTICGIRTDLVGMCWGENTDGQVGNGEVGAVTAPTATENNRKFVWLETRAHTTCGIAAGGDTAAGGLLCWGLNEASGRISPTRVDENLNLTTGSFTHDGHLCAIDGAARAWCLNGFGGGSDRNGLLTRVAGDTRFQNLTVRAGTACGLTTASTVVCWGEGSAGQLGNGQAADSNAPVQVALPHLATDLAVGDRFACALDDHRHVSCWGEGSDGQLGNADTGNAAAPVETAGALRLAHVAAGPGTGYAVDWKGRLYGWGLNQQGQAGVGSTADVARPTIAQTATTVNTPGYTPFASYGR